MKEVLGVMVLAVLFVVAIALLVLMLDMLKTNRPVEPQVRSLKERLAAAEAERDRLAEMLYDPKERRAV